jgi:hypothetical protein
VPILVVDVEYEFELFYNNIFKDLLNGGELISLFGLGGNWRKAIKLMENEDGTRFEYRRTPSLIHHLSFRGPSLEPPFLLITPPSVVIPSLLPISELNIHFDGGYAFNELNESTFEDLVDWGKLGSHYDLLGN